MKTRVIPYACVVAPNFNTKLPAGTEVFVNKVPWDWQVHVRVGIVNDQYYMYVFNAELPDVKYNPNMDDFHQLLWYKNYSSNLEDFQKKLESLDVQIPEGFWEKVRLYRDNKCAKKQNEPLETD